MLANNESGALQPVKEVAQECRKRGILCHTDAAVSSKNVHRIDRKSVRRVLRQSFATDQTNTCPFFYFISFDSKQYVSVSFVTLSRFDKYE